MSPLERLLIALDRIRVEMRGYSRAIRAPPSPQPPARGIGKLRRPSGLYQLPLFSLIAREKHRVRKEEQRSRGRVGSVPPGAGPREIVLGWGGAGALSVLAISSRCDTAPRTQADDTKKRGRDRERRST